MLNQQLMPREQGREYINNMLVWGMFGLNFCLSPITSSYTETEDYTTRLVVKVNTGGCELWRL
jgi:hypothetical protein